MLAPWLKSSGRLMPFFLHALLPGLALSLAMAQPSPGPPPQPARGLRVLSETPLPASFRTATDVRWTGEHTALLALRREGVVEIDTRSPEKAPRVVFQGASKLGGLWLSYFVAASPRYEVAAAPVFFITWRKRGEASREEEAFAGVKAIDLRQDRLLVVGARRNEKGDFAPEGGVAWVGSLDKRLADLRPVLYDVAGPGGWSFDACGAMRFGAARFLADGGYVIAPGFQPGISLFDAAGKLLQTWDTGSLGVDTDCRSLTRDQVNRLAADLPGRVAWENQRRTIQALLVLPQGIGLIVRYVERGKTRWDLKLLRTDGLVESFPVPLATTSEYFYLKGDVRRDRILFLLAEDRPNAIDEPPPRLFQMSFASTDRVSRRLK